MMRTALLVIMGASLAAGQPAVNARFASRTIQRVCLLPAEATLYKSGMKGGEGMAKESEEWAVRIGEALREGFVARGAKIVGDYSPDKLQADEKLREAVLQVEQRYDVIRPQIRKKPGQVKKGRYTVGDEIAVLPCAASADAVVFAQASGMVLTPGGKALGIALNGPFVLACPRSVIWLTLADAKSGEVIAVTRMKSYGGEKFVGRPDEAYRWPLERDLKAMHVGQKGRTS